MKLKYRILQNQRLYSVFQALMMEKMPLKAAYKMKRFADKLDQETKSYQTFMQDALKKYEELPVLVRAKVTFDKTNADVDTYAVFSYDTSVEAQ